MGVISTMMSIEAQKQMAREQMTYNHGEALLQRQFESEQAQLQRDWSEQQYLQYNSPEAMMRQYREAGLNPSLMYGGAQATDANMQSAAPSGAQASAGSQSISPINFGDFMNVMQLWKTKAEIDNIKADTTGKDITNEQLGAKLTAEIESLTASAGLSGAETEVAKNNAALLASKIPFASDVAEAEKNYMISHVAIETANAKEAGYNVDNWSWRNRQVCTISWAESWAKQHGWTVTYSDSLSKAKSGHVGASDNSAGSGSFGVNAKGDVFIAGVSGGISASGSQTRGGSDELGGAVSGTKSHSDSDSENASGSRSYSHNSTVIVMMDPETKTITCMPVEVVPPELREDFRDVTNKPLRPSFDDFDLGDYDIPSNNRNRDERLGRNYNPYGYTPVYDNRGGYPSHPAARYGGRGR